MITCLSCGNLVTCPSCGSSLPAPAVGDQAIRRSSYKRARGVKRQLSWWELRRHEDERDLS